MYPHIPTSPNAGRNSVRNMLRVGCLYWTWQQWLKAFLILLYSLFVIAVLPWLIVNTVKDGFTRKDQLILVGGLFVLVSIPLCVWHILQHMLHFTKPILQRPIIRILWMVPIYAVNAVCVYSISCSDNLFNYEPPNYNSNNNNIWFSFCFPLFRNIVAGSTVSRAVILHGQLARML